MRSSILQFFCISCICFGISLALDNGLARTPPMGWSAWNKWQCHVNCTEYPDTCLTEEHVKQAVDAIVTRGMKDVGYEYINLDDCYLGMTRDKEGKLQGDPQRFPSGLKSLGDYIHGKGLKFGVYADCGTKTCAGYPGSLDNEVLDANTFSHWGVDYLKLDACNLDTTLRIGKYVKTGAALNQTGRPIVYSCSYPAYNGYRPWVVDWDQAMELCNLWRYNRDIGYGYDIWRNISDFSANNQEYLIPAAGPGHWNDPDMLEIGNDDETIEEWKAHFSTWAMLAAPLIAGNDVRYMSDDIVDILTNEEVIAVDQDRLGRQGERIIDSTTHQVWIRDLNNGHLAVMILNKIKEKWEFHLEWKDIGLDPTMSVQIRDLWQHRDMGVFEKQFSAHVDSRGCVMLVFKFH